MSTFLVRIRIPLVALSSALVLASAGVAIAGHRPDRIQCCRTRSHGAVKCRVKIPERCAATGGVDVGPGTCHPNACAATTTSTITPTTTTAPGHVQVLIEPLAASASCGGPGYGTPASPPLSGEVDDEIGRASCRERV